MLACRLTRTTLVCFLLVLVSAGPAAADAEVLVPSDAAGVTTIELTRTGDGLSGTLQLANPGTTVITLGDLAFGECTLKPLPTSLPSGRTASVTFTAAACDEDGSEAAPLSLDPAEPVEVSLVVKSNRPVALQDSLGFFIGAFCAAVVMVLIVGIWLKARGHWRGLTEDLPSIPAAWSFKDSWASNLSVGATVFVGVFGTKDVIAALFGSAADSLIADLLVIGVVAALFVGLAPLWPKGLGKSSQPNTVGLLAGGAFTITGVVGQISASAYVLARAQTDDSFAEDLTVAAAYALVGALVLYAARTLYVLLREASHSKTLPPSEALMQVAALAYLVDPSLTDEERAERLLHLYDDGVNYLQLLKVRSAKSEKEKEKARESGQDDLSSPAVGAASLLRSGIL